MSDIFPDPSEEFLNQDPRALRDPRALQDPLQLTPAENKEIVKIHNSVGVVPIAVGMGAAYMVYRKVMARRIAEEVTKAPVGSIKQRMMLNTVSVLWNAFVPKWVSMTAPYLLAGYVEGIQSAHSGSVPKEYLETIARGYSEQLGHHINDTSTEALLSGFQAQVNRKVPPLMAAWRTADAYGVTKRGMNALVNVWTSEDQKKFTDRVLPNAKEDRVKFMIAQHNKLRAKQIGDNEEWAAHTQSKQLVWMYGQQHGVIPSTARRVWITAFDEKVCKICGPMNDKAAEVGDKFELPDGKHAWTPPTHVNCRCDVVLDLNVTPGMQDEITQLLEEEAGKVDKAMGSDPFDRDKSGRFAPRESRQAQTARAFKMTPVTPEPSLEERRAKFLAERKAAKKTDPLTKDPLRTQTKDPLAGRKGGDPLAGRKLDVQLPGGGDPLAGEGEVVTTREIKTKDPLGAPDPVKQVSFNRDISIFRDTDVFKQKQDVLASKIDVLVKRVGLHELPPMRNWEKTPYPLIALLEPQFASDNPYDEDDDVDRQRQYEDLTMSGGSDFLEVQIKKNTRFFEWHPSDSGPDQAEHPVTKQLETYWLKTISKEVTAYERRGEDNYTRIRGADGQKFVVDPKAYGQILAAQVYDTHQDSRYAKNNYVWLTPEGYEGDYSDIGSQVPWDLGGASDKLIQQGENPWDWIDTHTPTFMITDYANTMEAVHHPGAGSYAGWEMGAFENPGAFDIEDLHADWADDFQEGSLDPQSTKITHLPVVIVQGTPTEMVEDDGRRNLDQEMHAGDKWEIYGEDE